MTDIGPYSIYTNHCNDTRIICFLARTPCRCAAVSSYTCCTYLWLFDTLPPSDLCRLITIGITNSERFARSGIAAHSHPVRGSEGDSWEDPWANTTRTPRDEEEFELGDDHDLWTASTRSVGKKAVYPDGSTIGNNT